MPFRREQLSSGEKLAIYEPYLLAGILRRIRVVVFFHGLNPEMFAGNWGSQLNGLDGAVYVESLPKHLKDGTITPDCVVIMPYGNTNNNWNDYSTPYYQGLINYINSTYTIHPGYVVWASYSGGATSAWKAFLYATQGNAAVRNFFTHYIFTSGFPTSGEYDMAYAALNRAPADMYYGNNNDLDPNTNGQAFDQWLTNNGKQRGNIRATLINGGNHSSVTNDPNNWKKGLAHSGIDMIGSRVSGSERKKAMGICAGVYDFFNIDNAGGNIYADGAARVPYYPSISFYLLHSNFYWYGEGSGRVYKTAAITALCDKLRALNPDIEIEFRLVGTQTGNTVEADTPTADRNNPESYSIYAGAFKALYGAVGSRSYVRLKVTNEPDIQQGFVPGRDYMTPKQYAAMFYKTRQVNRAAYPGAKVHPAGLYSGTSYLSSFISELRTFSGNSSDMVDSVSVHIYSTTYSEYLDPDQGTFRDRCLVWKNYLDTLPAVPRYVSEYGFDSNDATTSPLRVPDETMRGYKIERCAEIIMQTGFTGGEVFAYIDEAGQNDVGGGIYSRSGDIKKGTGADKTSYVQRVTAIAEDIVDSLPELPFKELYILEACPLF